MYRTPLAQRVATYWALICFKITHYVEQPTCAVPTGSYSNYLCCVTRALTHHARAQQLQLIFDYSALMSLDYVEIKIVYKLPVYL
jgi:hypothetical protein